MLGPIVDRELAAIARKPRSYALRSVYAFVLLAVIFAGCRDVLADREQAFSHHARQVYFNLLLVQGTLAVFLTPALVAGAVASEAQRKTLGDLLTTDLGSAEIVLGKLAARLIGVSVLLATGMPAVLVAGLLGGVAPRLIALSWLATVSTAFLVGGLAILGSVLTRSVRGAMNFVFTLALTWLVLPCAADVMLPRQGAAGLRIYAWLEPINAWLSPTSPFAFWIEALHGRFREPEALAERIFWMVGLQLAYGAMLIGLAIAGLRPCQRGVAGFRLRRSTGIFANCRSPRRSSPAPCGEDPMIWKELFASQLPAFYRPLGLTVALVLIGLIAWGTIAFALPALREAWATGYALAPAGSARAGFHAYLRLIATNVSMVVLLGVASDAAASITSEHERDTWISLVATPLTGTEIVRAKLLGSLWGARHSAATFAALVVAGVLAGSIDARTLPLLAAELLAVAWFAAALGTWISLRSRDTVRALARTMGVLVAINGIALVAGLPFGSARPFAYSGCVPMTIAVSIASHGEMIGDAATAGPAVVPVTLAVPARLWMDHGLTLFAGGLLGAAGYAGAAWWLTRSACRQFDALLDRPALSGADASAELAPSAWVGGTHPEFVR
jgi:ABC-type transport system involved in multi-copper enzyme maturation permease subunit